MAFPATTTRYLLFLLNLIFLVSALVVAVIAILVEISFFNHNLFLEQDWKSPPVLIAIACVIIGVVSLFGCCGVIRESRCCLILFSGLLFIVVIGEIAAGIYVFSTKTEIANELQTRMTTTMRDYNQTETATRSWNVLQHDFRCCGVKNATDWVPVLGNQLPESCCREIEVGTPCTLKDASKEGCYSRFAQFTQSKSVTLAFIVIGVGIVQLLCAIASGLLTRHINKQYEAV
jgi:CD63 antigen